MASASSGAWCSYACLWSPRMLAAGPIWRNWPVASALSPIGERPARRRTGAVRRPRPRGTHSGGDAPVVGPGAGRLRPAEAARPAHPEPGCSGGDRLHDLTTTAFLCASVGAPTPYRRRLRFGAAVLAAPRRRCGTRWSRGCGGPPTGRSVDCSIRHQRSLSRGSETAGIPERRRGGTPDRRQHVRAGSEPAGRRADRRTAERATRRMMLADHLAFGALEQLGATTSTAIRAVATQFQLTALEGYPRGRLIS